MGLIYNPADSHGLVEALNNNLRNGQEVVNDLKRGSQQLINALGKGSGLSGAAYEAGKGLFSLLVLPTISKAANAMEDVRSELSKYENYVAAVGEELLDEDKLNEQIQEKQRQKALLDSMIGMYRNQAALHADDSDLSAMYGDFQKQLGGFLSTAEQDIQEIQKKLRKLHEFNSNVANLFTSSLNQFDQAMKGLELINNSAVNVVTGAFTLPQGFDFKNYDWLGVTKDGVSSEVRDELISKMITNGGKLAQQTLESSMQYAYNLAISSGKNASEAYQFAMQYKYAGNAVKLSEFAAEKGLPVVGGIFSGIDDYNSDKDIGKAVVHGGVIAGVGLGAGWATSALVTAFALSGPVGWAVGAGVTLLAVGVSIGVDFAFSQEPVKKFFKDSGEKISDFFGSIGKGVSW